MKSNITKQMKNLNKFERDEILSNYSDEILILCAKYYKILKIIWLNIISELKKYQLLNHRGKIRNQHFFHILKIHGVNLDLWEPLKISHAFRVSGMLDVINFHDFLKVCTLLKMREKDLRDENNIDIENDIENENGSGDDNNYGNNED